MIKIWKAMLDIELLLDLFAALLMPERWAQIVCVAVAAGIFVVKQMLPTEDEEEA